MRRRDACRRAGTTAGDVSANRTCTAASTRAQRVEHRVVPRQHVSAQAWALRHDLVEELAEWLRIPVVRAVRHETHAAVDVPSEYEDRVLRLAQRGPYRREVFLTVDQKCHACGLLDTPAVSTCLEQA